MPMIPQPCLACEGHVGAGHSAACPFHGTIAPSGKYPDYREAPIPFLSEPQREAAARWLDTARHAPGHLADLEGSMDPLLVADCHYRYGGEL